MFKILLIVEESELEKAQAIYLWHGGIAPKT